jgi:hypothetical protein
MTAAIANNEALVSPAGGRRERSPSTARLSLPDFSLDFRETAPACVAGTADCALAPVCKEEVG